LSGRVSFFGASSFFIFSTDGSFAPFLASDPPPVLLLRLRKGLLRVEMDSCRLYVLHGIREQCLTVVSPSPFPSLYIGRRLLFFESAFSFHAGALNSFIFQGVSPFPFRSNLTADDPDLEYVFFPLLVPGLLHKFSWARNPFGTFTLPFFFPGSERCLF